MPKLIVGYCDPLSAAPGDTVRFMVSSLAAEPFDAQLVRIVCGDISPDGAGFQEIEVSHPINGRYQGEAQPIVSGSYAVVERASVSAVSGLGRGRGLGVADATEQRSPTDPALDVGSGKWVRPRARRRRPRGRRVRRGRRTAPVGVANRAAARRSSLDAPGGDLRCGEPAGRARGDTAPVVARRATDHVAIGGSRRVRRLRVLWGPALLCRRGHRKRQSREPLQRPPRRLPTGLGGGPPARGAVGLRVRHRDGQDLRLRWARVCTAPPDNCRLERSPA